MSKKVYTKKGDDGTTSLLSGRRVSKTIQEIKAVGSLDELNSFVGLLRSETANAHVQLEIIQWNLFNAGSMLINDNETELTEVTLEAPEVSAVPDESLDLEEPDEPAKPEEPDEPEVPDPVDKPEEPDVPCEPDEPEVPAPPPEACKTYLTCFELGLITRV